MVKQTRLSRRLLVGGLLVSILCAQFTVVRADQHTRTPCNPPYPVEPNWQNFGYFETTWRQWPTQYRPEQKFPRAVGSEILPTPEGLPKESMPAPEVVPTPVPKTVLPEGGTLLEKSGTGVIRDGGTPSPGTGEPKQILPALPGQGPPGLNEQPLEPALPKVKADTGTATPILPEGPPMPEKPRATDILPEPSSRPGVTPQKPQPGGASPKDETPDVPALPRKGGTSGTDAPRTMQEVALPDRGWDLLGTATDHRSAATPGGPAEDRGATLLQADWAAALGTSDAADNEARPVAYSTEVPGPQEPAALGGFCPVELAEHQRWAPGDANYQATYGGQIFLLAGAAQRQRFLAAPERYVPGCAGNDPVARTDENRRLPGRVQYAAVYKGRVYLFAKETNIARFQSNPLRYIER